MRASVPQAAGPGNGESRPTHPHGLKARPGVPRGLFPDCPPFCVRRNNVSQKQSAFSLQEMSTKCKIVTVRKLSFGTKSVASSVNSIQLAASLSQLCVVIISDTRLCPRLCTGVRGAGGRDGHLVGFAVGRILPPDDHLLSSEGIVGLFLRIYSH